jgi:hypothetical protein
VQDVKDGAGSDQDDHDDNVCLHDGGRYERREVGERVAREHHFSPMKVTAFFLRIFDLSNAF